MCDFVPGQLIVMRPRGDGPAAATALRSLRAAIERNIPGNSPEPTSLDELRSMPGKPVWEGSYSKQPRIDPTTPPFILELHTVPKGTELSIAEEIRSNFFEAALTSENAVRAIARDPFQRLRVSPNWFLHPAAGSPDVVPAPFTLTNHAACLMQIGLNPNPNEAQGITVAVLDNGFDSTFWSGSPLPPPVAAGQDLIPADPSSSGHGTLVAALIAESAPGANVVPIRMAGNDSTEWDALHALDKALTIGAHVINFSYRQILGADNPCATCGLVRTAARSEVFAAMVEFASDKGRRAILAAAGNDGIGSIARPAAYNGAIAIAALDAMGSALWFRSNWDATNRLRVLALPGEGVAADTSSGSRYSGTSFATAYAAALFAVGMGRYGTTDARVVAANLQPLGVTMNATIPFLV
jgi:hypothetical protein